MYINSEIFLEIKLYKITLLCKLSYMQMFIMYPYMEAFAVILQASYQQNLGGGC